ncbi:phage protein GemA/Gp16 family protein [Hymenobacter glacieicola]|uniref:Uncharacterized protein n=1 Tax=Hymenobacter glacieicola TaxID=1562124 RepID=A0ABQ1WK80_9BACT|nr:hypothetical protein [Hymenobacter glacieicola]GGG33273.1 hypothetical protein GCM10011378_07130 [Hymenobacter glacieicola]
MLIKPWQNKYLHKLLNDLDLMDVKKELVASFSGKGSESSKDLHYTEADSLIKYLERQSSGALPTPEEEEASDKMRRKILSLAHEMQWELDNGKVDMARVNAWCQSKGFGKKVLNDYNHDQLTKLVSQFKIVHKKHLQELQK